MRGHSIRSESDPEHRYLSSQQPWRGMLVWGSKLRGRRGLMRMKQRCKPRDDREVDICSRRHRRKLRTLVCLHFSLAANHLFHATAVAVHRTTAGTFFLRHCFSGHAGQQGSCCKEQDQHRHEAGQALNHLMSICFLSEPHELNAVGGKPQARG